MTLHSSKIRRLAVATAALALAVVAAAPAGAWPDDPGAARADGVGSGSMPSAAVQQYVAQRAVTRASTAQRRTRPTARPRATNCRRPTGQASKSKPACRTGSMRARAAGR